MSATGAFSHWLLLAV